MLHWWHWLVRDHQVLVMLEADTVLHTPPCYCMCHREVVRMHCRWKFMFLIGRWLSGLYFASLMLLLPVKWGERKMLSQFTTGVLGSLWGQQIMSSVSFPPWNNTWEEEGLGVNMGRTNKWSMVCDPVCSPNCLSRHGVVINCGNT